MIEMLLSAGIMAVLMGTMVISLAVASRAGEDRARPARPTPPPPERGEEIGAHPAMALSFAERTPEAVTLTVPDRDHDGKGETIRYSWTGPDDGRLLRQVNGGPAVAIAENVRHFNLTYQLKTVAASEAKDKRWKRGKEDKDDEHKHRRDKDGRHRHHEDKDKDDDKDKYGKDKGKDEKDGGKKGHH